MNRITASYIQHLQSLYIDIGNRGICVDTERLEQARVKVKKLIEQNLEVVAKQWGCVVFIGAANNPGKDDKTAVNLNATQGERALLSKMKDIGYHVPKITSKNSEGEYEQKFSTGELALQKMLVENQFGNPAGDPAIRAILKIRELGKLQSSYLNTRLFCRNNEDGVPLFYFLSSYNTAGTITGRRSGKRHPFGYGNNPQNFPKHSESAKLVRECLTARPGNILLMVDQIQAEEWPVSALSMNYAALDQLRTNYDSDPLKRVDRHSELASKVFDEKIPWKVSPLWDDKLHGMKRYLGKKIKHARNYGMRKKRMSESLAQEGFSVSEAVCEILLAKAAAVDPTVDSVFHKYVIDTISSTHMLRTPFGRERMFLGARPNADNNTLFNEAFAYIPQSCVGDNTGFSVYSLETSLPENEREIVQEGHDSIVQDIRDEKEVILRKMEQTLKAFDRVIKFDNGIEINIPIEAEIGYDFKNTVVLETMDSKGLDKAYEKLQIKREKQIKENKAEAVVQI